MKSNELRIGNYYLSFGVDLKQVETLHKDKILIDFTPIPLTEEWLLKFGFEKRMFGWWSSVLFLRIDENEKCFWFDWSSTNESKGTELFFVHQIQNLFFALTNEELTIKK